MMCTVTLVPDDTGYRFFESRDESRGRVAGLMPTVRDLAGGHVSHAVWPTDPQGGGTWVALNGAGVSFSLLNYNLPRGQCPDATERTQSRGRVILRLMHAESAAHARAMLDDVHADLCLPFRLVVCDRREVFCWRSLEPGSEVALMPLDRPLMWTSSSLGDHLVQPPRKQLFRDWLVDGLMDEDRQRAFHRHQWPDRPELSVCMSREDARTVSMTEISVKRDVCRMIYHPQWPDVSSKELTFVLPRCQTVNHIH